MFENLLSVLFTIGLTLGVGSSTFALVFYIRSLEDGVVDASERRFMHTVYVVLRIGMAFLAVTLGAFFLSGVGYHGLQLYTQCVLLCVIAINAFLMDRRRMPMQFGPIIAGGSWYSLFFITETDIATYGVWILLLCYCGFLVLFYFVFQFLKRRFTIVGGSYGGDVMSDSVTLERYATDASAFHVMPQAVYFPKTVRDIRALIALVREDRKRGGMASLTLRAGGTCMSGGPLNESWIVDMTKYMHTVEIDPKNMTATVEMGAYFRDIEDAAKKYGLMFPAYPSSHRVCGIGGMIGNNASGEKSLRCGPTSANVLELEVVRANGSVERVLPKPKEKASSVEEQALIALYNRYGTALTDATGAVKKSASGYRLEKVIDGDTFNAVPLFVGAQGTLGIVTKAVLRLVPIPKHTELLLISAQSLKDISKIVAIIFKHNPEALETFDAHTFTRARVHLKDAAEKLLPYIDDRAHLYFLAQFSESTKKETLIQATECLKELKTKKYFVEHVHEQEVIDAAWEVRRNAFLLMRDHNDEVHRAVPCIEDVVVPLSVLGVFIERLQKILQKRTVHYGFHGHIGDGSLRIIPIFDFSTKTVQKDIERLMREVFSLVKKLHGNISADHSDGIIRTPYLREFYGDELYGVFEKIKYIYDPDNIMNPNKKVGGTVQFVNKCLDCDLSRYIKSR